MSRRDFTKCAYDKISQVKSANGSEYTGTSRLQEQFSYSYDKAWNLSSRNNNNLLQSFGVNNLNELTCEANSGTLTVAGTTLSVATNVLVSGLGLTNSPASLYADATWARDGATLATNDTLTASAADSYGRASSTSMVVGFPSLSPCFSYDDNGNLLSDGKRYFEYDYENQLTAVYVANAWRSEFAYDGFGRRRIRREYAWQSGAWSKTNEVRYIYDGRVVIQEQNTNSTPTVQYTRGTDLSGTLQGAGGIGGLLARSDGLNGMVGLPWLTNYWSTYATSTILPFPPTLYRSMLHSFYHADGNGNVTALFTPKAKGVMPSLTRYIYDPFGNLLAMSGLMAQTNLYRFSSKEFHPNSGLIYYLYRYYEPNLQRWINRDPRREPGFRLLVLRRSQDLSPAEDSNLYIFVGNTPLVFLDPLGLAFRPGQCVRGIGGLAGGIALTALGVALSEAGIGIPIAVSGAVGISYGIGNVVASFGDETPATRAMDVSPNNLGGFAGRAINGEKGQAIASFLENAVEMPAAAPNPANMKSEAEALEALLHAIEGALDAHEAGTADGGDCDD
jgi:RHS repeat-associated protein